ncbi:hypothetical protein TIFTF001_019867 [Ficus carica]|uniref:Secreted protein n=1 Tax=Ficus carica TaxID=3494 RepID=A0AA88DD55_FICCA|nr:hypothetical protein TIFTF001_019867 [Ficus carica]
MMMMMITMMMMMMICWRLDARPTTLQRLPKPSLVVPLQKALTVPEKRTTMAPQTSLRSRAGTDEQMVSAAECL